MNELETIVGFLNDIGIETEYRTIDGPTFLPGIEIEKGRIFIDLKQLKHPGDILHEAGHIAVTEEASRSQISGNVEPDSPAESLELAAMLWSYAALVHLNLEPIVVFHPDGYKGQSSWLIEQFALGTYIGLPLIQWMGLAVDDVNATAKGIKPFPHMIKWIRS